VARIQWFQGQIKTVPSYFWCSFLIETTATAQTILHMMGGLHYQKEEFQTGKD